MTMQLVHVLIGNRYLTHLEETAVHAVRAQAKHDTQAWDRHHAALWEQIQRTTPHALVHAEVESVLSWATTFEKYCEEEYIQ